LLQVQANTEKAVERFEWNALPGLDLDSVETTLIEFEFLYADCSRSQLDWNIYRPGVAALQPESPDEEDCRASKKKDNSAPQ
jgi:hypothetical protein